MRNSVLSVLVVLLMALLLAPSADAQRSKMANGIRKIGKLATRGGREYIKYSSLTVPDAVIKRRQKQNERNRELQQRLKQQQSLFLRHHEQWLGFLRLQEQQRKRLQQQEQHRRRLQQMLSTPPVALSSHRDWLVGHSASFTPSPLTSQRDALRRVSEEVLVSDMPLTCTADSCATEQSITIATDSAECSSSSDALQTDRVYDR